mmetsp:Transcript_18151/g.45769  ORF Transcript_18151/g.45769 Transcript_18151/m.45769 type:complete len:82 (-) Transcript_18151:657-902(-)
MVINYVGMHKVVELERSGANDSMHISSIKPGLFIALAQDVAAHSPTLNSTWMPDAASIRPRVHPMTSNARQLKPQRWRIKD